MSSTTWKIIGAASAVAGYQLLKCTVSVTAGCIFVGLLIAVWIALALSYRRRLVQLREQFSELSPEERRRVLEEVDPEIGAGLQKGKKND